MKTKQLILFFVILFFSILEFKAQYKPPTLSGGLESLVYSKGTIDVELLSAIIASKQEELQKETIKRLILNDLDVGSFAFYNYVFQVLDVILHEKNKTVITKEIGERTVNLAMVYSFLEFYLHVEWQLPQKRDSAFIKMMEFSRWRPQYLSLNQQADWQQNIRNKTAGGQGSLLFKLKSPSFKEINKELGLLEELDKEIKSKMKNVDYYILSNELNKLNIFLGDFKNQNNNYLKNRNIEIPREQSVFLFGRSPRLRFDSAATQQAKLKKFNESVIEITKKEYKGSKLIQLTLYQETTRNIDSLISFTEKLKQAEAGNENRQYSLLVEKISSPKTSSIKNTNLFFEFKEALKIAQKDSLFEESKNLKNVYSKLLKEVLEAELNSIKSNQLKPLSQIISKLKYINEIKNDRFSNFFDEISSNELFIAQRNYGNFYIEQDTKPSETYSKLIDKTENIEQELNEEYKINKLKELVGFCENPEQAKEKGFLYNNFSQKLRNNKINEYQEFYGDLDNYLKNENYLSVSYLDNSVSENRNVLLSGLNLSKNKVYSEVELVLDILEMYEKEAEKEKIYLLNDRAKSTIDSIGINKVYSNLKKMLTAHKPEQIQKKIEQLREMNISLDSLKKMNMYKNLTPQIQAAYTNFSYEISENIIKEDEYKNFRNTPEYKQFINELVKWKINQEKLAILKHIKNLEKDWVNFSDYKEYQKLNKDWLLYEQTEKLQNYATKLQENDLILSEIQEFKEFTKTETYPKFKKLFTKYEAILNENVSSEEIQQMQKTLKKLPKHSLNSKNRQFLLNYTDLLLFKTKFTEINRLKQIWKQLGKEETEIVPLNMILLDMVYDICYTNPSIQKTGFFNESKEMDMEQYERANAYLSMEISDPEFFPYLENVRSTMQKRIEMFFNFYQLIQELDYFEGQSLDEIRNKYIDQLKTSMNDSVKLKKMDKSNPFIDISRKITEVETIFTNAKFHLKRIKKEREKVNTIQQSIKDIKSKEQSEFISNYSKQEDNKLIKNLKRQAAYIAIDSILFSAKSIETEFENLKNFKIFSHANQLSKIIKRLDYLEKTDYNYSFSIADTTFVKEYEYKNDSILLLTSLLAEEIDRYERDIYADLLSQNNYVSFNLRIFKESIQDFEAQNLSEEDQEILAQVYSYISSLEKPGNNLLSFEFISHLRHEIIPQLVAINIKYRRQYNTKNTIKEIIPDETETNQQISIESLENILNFGYFMRINSFYDPENLISPEIIRLSARFIDMISRLNKLDEVQTYSVFFDALNDAGNIFPDSKAITTFNNFSNNVLKHTILDNKENTIEFDVESFIMLLYDRYKDVSVNNWGLYFSIGLNQATFLKTATFTKPDNTTYELDNLAFAAEKIGFKYKIIDFNERALVKRQYANKYYSAKPLISDWHLITYGSGLLYNVVNTTTNENNFKTPLLGIGMGITFYNSMDLNVFYNIPAEKDAFQKSMIGFSFDIKLGEYIQELNKQRKLQKMQKNN